MLLSNRLKERRDAAGMTIQELSEESGISRPHIYSLEKEGKDARSQTIRDLAKALKTTPSYLEGYTDNYEPIEIERSSSNNHNIYESNLPAIMDVIDRELELIAEERELLKKKREMLEGKTS
jgi:transcriptional regulator with XRE-family HTH domain